MMKLELVNKSGKKDISNLVSNVTWSGDKSSFARTVKVSVAVSKHDHYLPKVYIATGNMIILSWNNTQLFQGYVFSKSKSNDNSTMDFNCYDGLIYIAKSSASYNFKKMTAGAITKKVCSDLGVPAGSMASSPAFNLIVRNKKCNEIIKEAYKKATLSTGKLYLPVMQNGKLNIIEKGAKTVNVILSENTNITNSSYSESIEDMVNKIVIVDDKDNTIDTVTDSELISNYGTVQTVYQKQDDVDYKTAALNLIRGLSQDGYVAGLGNVECITGNAVNVKEPYTGFTGLFYIDKDEHIFENGQHNMQLSINYKNE